MTTIQKGDYSIVYPEQTNKKYKYPIVFYNGSHFKCINFDRILSQQIVNPDIVYIMECSHVRSGCKSRLTLFKDETAFVTEHVYDLNHINDESNWRRKQIVIWIKEALSMNPNITCQKFISNILQKKEFKIDVYTPDKKYISDALSYQKFKCFGTLPKSIETINLTGQNVETFSHERFLLFNLSYNHNKEIGKVIGFSSNSQLELLSKRNLTILGDGTFKYVPSLFCQLYTMHVVLEGHSFPVLFDYMQHKCKNAYYAIFNYLKQKHSLSMKVFMSDFEVSVRSCVHEIFGDSVIVKGCWFHFLQSIIKRVKKVNLGKEYSTNTDINLLVRKMFSWRDGKRSKRQKI